MPSSAAPVAVFARGGAGEAEVADLDAAVVGEQHVLGLEVAVHDAGLCAAARPDSTASMMSTRLLGRERPLLLQQLAQRDARAGTP